MLLRWKGNLNIFNVFIVALVMRTEIVTGFIDYSEIRRNEHPIVLDPHLARTTRQLLEKYDSWAVYRTSYTLQQATEHFLHYGAFLRNQILDTFGALVYDNYDDFSMSQLEALYRVYRDTLKRKYNIFDIVPSVLAQSDMRPSSICRHINKNVRTCLRESSLRCATMKQHDKSHPHTILTRVFNITRYMFKTAGLKQQFPEGFSLPAILERLKSGHLSLTAGMVSGLLQSVQYDSFNDEVRAAEKNVMQLLMSEKLDSGRKQSLMPRDQLRQVLTVNELLKNIFDGRKSMYDRNENKNFDVLSQHVISEVEAISPNIEILGAVYDNNTIQMKYLFDLVLPPDVVDRDISDAKNYLLNKMQDFDVVRKYLKVEKYQQSGPDQLLMEILRQMRDINFAPDIVTALHTHARFWHQSRMINNLNDLLDLFDAYENLRNVPNFSNLVSLMDDIRGSLINSKVVAIELLCSNPRSCLQRGLKIIAQCTLVNSKTKSLLVRLFHNLNQDGSIDIDKCKRSTNQLITEVLKPSLQARSEKTGEVTSELTIQNDSNNMELSGAKNNNTAVHETATEMITVENFVEKQLEVKLRASEEPTTITTTNTNSLEEDDSDKAYNRFFGHCLGMECSDYFSFDSNYLDYFSGDWLESSSSEEEQHHHEHKCIGKNCPPSWMPNKPQHCANGNCGTPSVPEHPIECIGSDCNYFIPPSVSYPECIGNRCDNKQECIGKNCPPSWMPNKPQHCANGNCGIPSVPEHPIECIGSDCNYFPPTGPSPSECIFPNCNKPPLSNNLVCSGNKCKPSGEVNPWTLDESKLTMTVLPYNQCKFKDPQYQRRLDRLKKIRILDSFYATESVPTDAAASFHENFSDESHGQSAPPTKHRQSSHLVRSTQRKPPQNELLTRHKRPWPFTFYPFTSHSGQVLKIKKPVTFNDSYADSNMGSGIKSGISAIKNHTNKRRKMNVNVNVNVNRDSKNRQKRLQRHFISGSRGVVTSQTLGSEVKPLRNTDYRSSAVDVRVGEHSGLSNPSTMYSDIKKKQANNQMRTNHVPHQTRSDGKIDVVRKRRSIITAPRRTNHRSGSL